MQSEAVTHTTQAVWEKMLEEGKNIERISGVRQTKIEKVQKGEYQSIHRERFWGLETFWTGRGKRREKEKKKKKKP